MYTCWLASSLVAFVPEQPENTLARDFKIIPSKQEQLVARQGIYAYCITTCTVMYYYRCIYLSCPYKIS